MNDDLFRLDGKNIVITGASSGIGRQCAIECSRKGANVIMIARNETKLQETLIEMEKLKHTVLPLDMSKIDEIKDGLIPVISDYGNIHGFLHSAGMEVTTSLNQMKLEKYKEMFDVNLFSAFEISRLITKRSYLYDTGASVVFIASIFGIKGGSAVSGYSASKGALISATRSLAVELASKKVRVNCISPGLVMTDLMKKLFDRLSPEEVLKRTEKYPLGVGTAQDIASASVYLLSDASRWVTGINLVVDGGACAR